MKHKTLKVVALILLIIVIYFIYNTATKYREKINYIALGDSLAEGMNSYGEINYSYADYIKDYLKSKKKLGTYSKKFSKSGYKTSNIIEDIENNKTIKNGNKTENIRRALRESKLVTISIGANDFISNMNISTMYEKLNNIEEAKKEIKEISYDVETVIIEVKKYAKNEILLIGYYNPFPHLKIASALIDELITYSNNLYKEVCQRQNIKYIDIYSIFNKNKDYLPNPYDIHPNTEGYEAISKEIVKNIKNITE